MASIEIVKGDGGKAAVDTAAVDQLKSQIQGRLLLPGDDGYDEARTIWNAMIDRRSALIVSCASAADVQQAVAFAAAHGLLLAVRGGGHNIAGNAVCDNGLMIDLSPMKAVTVDATARRAGVEPGATLGDVDQATQAHALATPTGINSTTGIAGLTLGGGFGWLSRKLGLTIDNLVSAEVVTADGNSVRASATENADLFWGIRGGGGNLGVVTSFEFQLHPLGPEVLCGPIVFPADQAKSVLRQYREFVATAPDELTVWVVLRKAPPLPFLPEEVHGKDVVVLAACYAGDVAEGERLVAPIRGFGDSYGEHIGPAPYADFQTAFDPLLVPRVRNYWKSHNFMELSDEVLEIAIDAAAQVPSPHCEVILAQLGGETSRVAPDATAYHHRGANFVLNVHGRWETAQEDEKGIAWARGLFNATAPFATGGVYVNFMTEEEGERVAAAYGPNHQRMVQLKKKFDPTNLFRLNQNVDPAG